MMGGLAPGAVRVELYADPKNEGEVFRQPMERSQQFAGSANSYVYSTHTPATRDPNDFTPRVVPYHAEASVPLEAGEILWQK